VKTARGRYGRFSGVATLRLPLCFPSGGDPLNADGGFKDCCRSPPPFHVKRQICWICALTLFRSRSSLTEVSRAALPGNIKFFRFWSPLLVTLGGRDALFLAFSPLLGSKPPKLLWIARSLALARRGRPPLQFFTVDLPLLFSGHTRARRTPLWYFSPCALPFRNSLPGFFSLGILGSALRSRFAQDRFWHFCLVMCLGTGFSFLSSGVFRFSSLHPRHRLLNTRFPLFAFFGGAFFVVALGSAFVWSPWFSSIFRAGRLFFFVYRAEWYAFFYVLKQTLWSAIET